MAFQIASNYQNLPNGYWSPAIFSKNMQEKFRKKAVVNDITNSD